ncbi:hypothetical protein DEO72_LG9g925 [Vigna unguiculata]|uniref:Uncharacterized protein n=1 Tax=Vigna unguiculata TaxID=3917 RepID=A0A4D6MWR0_VIGUN|nr:hypothetical protein DEO72_LG9g925 [Vigna unguiculata]
MELLVWCLAGSSRLPGDRNCRRDPCIAWRLAASSPFLFVYGDNRVIRYTGANVAIGDAEDAQATE